MNNSIIFKRIGAYLIDILIITLIGMAITKLSFINPKYDEYLEASNKYNNLLTDYYDKKIEVEEVNKKTMEISYELNKSGAVFIACDIVTIILYFGVFAFVTKGETLGKKMMGLRIVNTKDKPLKIYNYIIRCIILNGILMDVVTLIAICFSKDTYYNIYSLGSNINMIINIVIFVSVMFTSNGRGLHDIIAGTQVIDAKKLNNEVPIVNKDEKEKKENKIVTEEGEVIKPKKSKSKKKGERKDE